MKLLFSFFLFFLLSSQTLLARDISREYLIKTRGITIGSLIWRLSISEDAYKTSVELKDRGFLSKLYSFSGNYSAEGTINKKIFFPTRYIQYWKTPNKTKYVELKFKGNMVESITLRPQETELERVQYKKIENYKDPLSALINILLIGGESYTIDGRRVYLLSPDKKGKKIIVKKYVNIWADHKRNDLEYLEVEQDEKNILPEKIAIKFKGSLFYLKKI